MARMKKTHSRDRLESLQQELDQVLGDLLNKRGERFSLPKRQFEIRVDVYETEDAIHVRAETPGMTKDDLQLYLTRDMIIIEGQKHARFKSDSMRFLNLEREFGKFTREVAIPKPIDGRTIEAKMVLGVLHVIMPKISERRGERKRVPIGD